MILYRDDSMLLHVAYARKTVYIITIITINILPYIIKQQVNT